MVVGAPDVDGLVKAADGQLIIMVGDVGGKVGGDAVGTDEDLVLGLFLAAVVSLFLVDDAVLGGVLGAAVHDSAIFGLVAGTDLQQLIHNRLDRTGLVQVALVEPDIIIDTILAQVALQAGNVLGQGVGNGASFSSSKSALT